MSFSADITCVGHLPARIKVVNQTDCVGVEKKQVDEANLQLLNLPNEVEISND